jgi:biotin carboxylase
VFTRIAIVNRGEAAMRLIHAVRELNGENTASTIETVALYTEAERTATFVREADDSYCIGPASARPYLDHTVLERALVETRADAAWVGWGFVAEDPAFAELCDKIGAKLIAEEVGVPVAPWSRGAVETLDAAKRAAAEIGYPLMLKATAGGGGRGIRVVRSDDELSEAY